MLYLQKIFADNLTLKEVAAAATRDNRVRSATDVNTYIIFLITIFSVRSTSAEFFIA